VHKAIERGDLGAFLKQSGSTITCAERDGTYEILSAEGELAHGINPSAGVVDEWWQFKHRSQREGYNAIAEALQKRPGESWLLAISQAYYDFNSMMAETHQAAMAHPRLQLERDGCLAILEDPDSGFLMHWYGAPENADIEDNSVLEACNPLSAVSAHEVRKLLLKPGADEADWRRLHLNQPTKGEHSWVPSGVWARLLADGVRIPAGAGLYLGIDAAYSGDTTAVVFAWRGPDGRVHVRAQIWSTEAQRKHNKAHDYVRRRHARQRSARRGVRARAREALPDQGDRLRPELLRDRGEAPRQRRLPDRSRLPAEQRDVGRRPRHP